MPLARAAMYAQGVDIYLAPTWDNGDAWVATLRHIAKEGRVYVIGVSPVLRATDVPRSCPPATSTAATGLDEPRQQHDRRPGRGHPRRAGIDRRIVYAEIDAAAGPGQPPAVRSSRTLQPQRCAAPGRGHNPRRSLIRRR